MKIRNLILSLFTCLTLSILLLSCQPETQRLPIQDANVLPGLASPIQLEFEYTDLIWKDYFPLIETIDSFDLPKGLRSNPLVGNAGIKLIGVMDEGAGNLRAYVGGAPYDIPVLRSKTQQYLFQFSDPKKAYGSVTISGSMNDWNPTKDSLGYSNGFWIKPMALDPGNYEYQLLLDGRESLDPNNTDSVMGMSGNYNSVFKVASAMKAMGIQLDSIEQEGFAFEDQNGADRYLIYWNNLLLDKDYYQVLGSRVTVKIPAEAKAIDSSHMRVWSVKGPSRSNNLLIPLSEGKVMD